jgi:hypothetical protein
MVGWGNGILVFGALLLWGLLGCNGWYGGGGGWSFFYEAVLLTHKIG